MSREIVERQAKLLATDNRKADPGIVKVYWFPDDEEVRLVELLASIPRSGEGSVRPFHFRPHAAESLPAPSATALIRPDEFGKLELPSDWGTWDDAILLEDVAEEGR